MRNLQLLLCICSIAISSCKYSCPAYDGSDKSIISFRQNDTITYISSANDTIKLLVFNAFFEGESSWRGLAMDYECVPEAYYEALDNKTGIYIKEQDASLISVSFCEDTPYKGLFDQEHDMKCVPCATKEIGENVYPCVWEVEDLSGQRRIDKFIKVDFHGILEFHDKATGLTWTQKTR